MIKADIDPDGSVVVDHVIRHVSQEQYRNSDQMFNI